MKWVSSWCWWIDSCKVSPKGSHPWGLVTASGVVMCAKTPCLGCAEGWSLLWSPGQVLSLGQCYLSWPCFSDGHTQEQAVPWAHPLTRRAARRDIRSQQLEMLKFFSSFLEGLRSGKSCKNTGEKLSMQWKEETSVGVRGSRTEGLPLTLISLDMAQHSSHTVLNRLGNLSSGNGKSENWKRVLKECCRAIQSTALRSCLWDWCIGDSREPNVLQNIYSFQISFFMDNCITPPL